MRSIRAVIQTTPSATTLVAGIPLLARTVLTLCNTGITRFTLIDHASNPVTVHAAALREIARVAPSARLTWIKPGDPDPNALTGMKVLAAPTSGIFNAGLVSRLIISPAPENLFVALTGTEKAQLWVLSADVYDLHAGGNEVFAVPATLLEGEYFPVGTDVEIDEAERALFRWCVKETDGIVSRNLNRPISNWISRRLSHGTVRPSQLTALTGLSALAMFTALVGGTQQFVAIGCVLYHVTSVIDGLDGEIARAKYMSTSRGATLDTAVDMATNLLFILGISIGNHQVYDPIYGWIGGYVAFIASIAMTIMALTLHFGPGGGSFDVLELTIRKRLRGSPRLVRVFAFINAFFKRDLFALVFAIMGAIGFAEQIPWLLAFGATIWLIAILANVPTLLNSRREEVLPPHVLRASGNGAADYASSRQ